MPYTKIYIHIVWSTKLRIPYLDSQELRSKVWSHIKENAKLKGVNVDTINGHKDHCHCLIALDPTQTIREIIQLIKGESSWWINKNNLCKEKFSWQEEYFATSVSNSNVECVRQYIMNQEEHHARKGFVDEYLRVLEDFRIAEKYESLGAKAPEDINLFTRS